MSQLGESSSFESQLNFPEATFAPDTDLSAIDEEWETPTTDGRFYMINGDKVIYQLHVLPDRSPPCFELCNRLTDLPNERRYADLKFYGGRINGGMLQDLDNAWTTWVKRIKKEGVDNAFAQVQNDARDMQQLRSMEEILSYMNVGREQNLVKLAPAGQWLGDLITMAAR